MRHAYSPHVNVGKSTNRDLRVEDDFTIGEPMAEDPQYQDIGRRLRAVRTAFSTLGNKDWAEKHGFGNTQYHNWEKGERRITVDAALLLSETYGLSLDWIYRGRRDGLSDKASKVV